jgi:hypothetical protein
MNKAIAATKLNIKVSDIKSVSINWTAPAGRLAVMLGPNSNIIKWYYSVELISGSILMINDEPTQAEILEFIESTYPTQKYYSKQ